MYHLPHAPAQETSVRVCVCMCLSSFFSIESKIHKGFFLFATASSYGQLQRSVQLLMALKSDIHKQLLTQSHFISRLFHPS